MKPRVSSKRRAASARPTFPSEISSLNGQSVAAEVVGHGDDKTDVGGDEVLHGSTVPVPSPPDQFYLSFTGHRLTVADVLPVRVQQGGLGGRHGRLLSGVSQVAARFIPAAEVRRFGYEVP